MNADVIKQCKIHAIENNVSVIRVLLDFLGARLKYGFSVEDYFINSKGVRLRNIDKRKFYSEHKCLCIQRKYNNKNQVYICDNKVEFLKYFSSLVKHKWCYPKEVSFEEFKSFLHSVDKVIAKPVDGIGKGRGVHVYVPSENLQLDYENYKLNNYLLEEFITQHKDMFFNNNSVNTIRVYTIVDSLGNVHIMKTILRVGVGGNSAIDSYSQGGVIYPVNIEGGFVEGYGVRKIDQKKICIHPETDIMMLGYKIPHWDVLINTMKMAASKISQVQYIGWDVAITPNGVDLIEANPDGESGMMERIGNDCLYYPRIINLLKGVSSR